MILLVTTLALAQGPQSTVEVAAGRSFVLQGEPGTGTAFEAAYAGRVAPRLMVEGRAQGQLIESGAALLRLGPAGRFYLGDPARRERFRPSLTAGGGLSVGEGVRGFATVGVDLDLPTGWPHHTRAGVTTFAEAGRGIGLGLRVALVGGRLRPEPESSALPAQPPQPAAPSEPTAAETSGRWWDPRTCDWVDEAPPHGWRPGDGIVLPPGVDAPRADGPATAATRFGWLVVVGTPADRVRLRGAEHAIGADGIARIRAPEGEVLVEVSGGGRAQRFEAAIADGYTLWLRVAPPPEVRVFFDAGSAEVSAADRVMIQELAENRGSYRLRISGSYSPEGDPQANLALADARARAIAALLERAGVPPAKIEVLPARPPEPGQTAARQRSVLLEPIPLEAP